jgi:hypothetical protein
VFCADWWDRPEELLTLPVLGLSRSVCVCVCVFLCPRFSRTAPPPLSLPHSRPHTTYTQTPTLTDMAQLTGPPGGVPPVPPSIIPSRRWRWKSECAAQAERAEPTGGKGGGGGGGGRAVDGVDSVDELPEGGLPPSVLQQLPEGVSVGWKLFSVCECLKRVRITNDVHTLSDSSTTACMHAVLHGTRMHQSCTHHHTGVHAMHAL